MKQNITTSNRPRLIGRTPIFKISFSFFILIGILAGSSLVAPIPILAADARINCNAHQGKCFQSSGNFTVALEIVPRPVKAMQDLVFKVSIEGVSPAKQPYIDLGMPAMKMGPNQVSLTATGPGTYEGTGVVVRCPSGKRTWFANVILPGSGEVKFIFDVIY